MVGLGVAEVFCSYMMILLGFSGSPRKYPVIRDIIFIKKAGRRWLPGHNTKIKYFLLMILEFTTNVNNSKTNE
ncbi:hypothetical protein I4300191C4_22780 [Solibaculum mannosilyticum]